MLRFRRGGLLTSRRSISVEFRIASMSTKMWTSDQIAEAATALASNQVVAFPTETVYGLGGNAFDDGAIAAIFRAKGRPSDNPLIVHVAAQEQLSTIVQEVTPTAQRLIEAFWPGPLTLVFNSRQTVSKLVTCGKDTVAVRQPSHPVALALIKAAGVPLAAPSANTSGRPSPTLAEHVLEDLEGRIVGIVDGGAADSGLESTVLDCVHEPPVILRPGSVTQEQIEAVIGPVRVATAHTSKDDAPRAPGMKYTHYAPKADLHVVHGSTAFFQGCVMEAQQRGHKVGVMGSEELLADLQSTTAFEDVVALPCGSRSKLETVSHGLYHTIRSFDHTQVNIIFAEGFSAEGLGAAIMNRLNKAAGNKSKREGEPGEKRLKGC